MRRTLVPMLVAAALACGSTAALAVDAWDLAADGDNNFNSTGNVLWHTAPAQIHDLEATADVDWFRIFPRARRSYEVQILNVAGDANVFIFPPQRYASDGTTVLQPATFLDKGGTTMSIRWIQGAAGTDELVKVEGDHVIVGPGSIYSIQLRETTHYCARYNNVSTQASVLILQHTDPDNTNACNYEVRFHNASGTEVGNSIGVLGAGSTNVVIATATVPGVAGTSGNAYIAHACGIGGINAKMVALEPATGFSFDTPCLARPSN